jgi:hypothetical protein
MWEKIGMRGKNLARRIVREVKTGIVVNKQATAMKKLRGGFVSALLSENCGVRGVAIASYCDRQA